MKLEQINKAKKAKQPVQQLIKQAKEIPDKIKEIEEKSEVIENQIKELMLQIPNIISKDAPIGKDESKNPEIKKSGKIPKFSFPIKNHVELIENLNIGNFEASSRVSGKGFYYLKNKLAVLNQALIGEP